MEDNTKDDKLKNLWKQNKSSVEVSENQVDDILKLKSNSVIARIIKTIRTEHILNIVSFPIIFSLLLYFNMYLEIILMVIIYLPFLIYYHFLLRRLKKAKIELNVHDYLLACYSNFKSFINHYRIAGVILGLVGYFIGFMITRHDKTHPFALLAEDGSLEIWLIIVLFFGAVLSFGFIWWIIHLLYGKKLKKLKLMIEELEA